MSTDQGESRLQAAQTLAELQASISALQARVAALEEADRTARATTRRLGLDVITLGRTLKDHLHAQQQAGPRPEPDQSLFPRRPFAAGRVRKAPVSLLPALIGSGAVLAAIAGVWILREGLLSPTLAPKPRPGAPAVVLADAPRLGTTAPSIQTEAPSGSPEQPGHVLYGAASEPPTPPVAPGKP